MKNKFLLCFLLVLVLTSLTSPALAFRTKRKPVVVPHNNGYVLVHGAYLRPIHGFHSIHPFLSPDPIATLIHLPIWNGIFWAYKYNLEPKFTVPGAF